MIAFMTGCIAGFVLGIVCAGLKWAQRTPVNGLPCPHPMCRAMLPRMGLWNGQGYVVESCHICGGSVLFNPYIGEGHDLNEKDNYIRFDRPEAKP